MSRTYGKAQDLIDFTRASSATALRRVKYGAELVTNGTFDTDSDWTKGVGWSISGGTAVLTGDGSPAALTQSGVLTVGVLYQVSFDVACDTGGIGIGNLAGGIIAGAVNGTVVANFVADTTNLYFKRITGTVNGTIDNVSVKEVTFDTSDGDLVLFNHPNNIPRIEYDANGNLLGLLVEEARTNLITYSEDFTQWSAGSGATISYGAFTSPDGLLSGTEVTSGGVGSDVFKSVSLSATTYAFSIWVRNTDLDVQIRIEGSGGLDHRLIVNNGVISSEIAIDSSGVTTYPNGLIRAYCVFTVTTAETKVISIQQNTGSMGLWGAQLEAGSFPTSLIPTSGSTATRSADVASLSTSAFGYRQDEGSVVVEATPFADSFAATRYLVDIGSASSKSLSCGYNPAYRGGYGALITATGTNATNVASKVISTGDSSGYSFTYNGQAPLTNATAFVVGADKLAIGGSTDNAGNSIACAHIKSIKYIPRRLTNAQLQELTS